MRTILKAENLTKTYKVDKVDVPALRGVSLDVHEGEFVAIMGPSGCGKSTLMLMIAGLLAPSAGEIHVNQDKVTEPRTDIGIMFQDNTLVSWRDVYGNVALQLELRGIDPKAQHARIDGILKSVRLEGFEHRYPHELSGGMQQRAAFCQAMVHEPSTVLLDEPLGKLDAMTRESIRGDLQGLWMAEKPTVVFVTHSIEEAVGMSDRVVVLKANPGRIADMMDLSDLPRPRRPDAPAVREVVDRMYTLLA